MPFVINTAGWYSADLAKEWPQDGRRGSCKASSLGDGVAPVLGDHHGRGLAETGVGFCDGAVDEELGRLSVDLGGRLLADARSHGAAAQAPLPGVG